MAAEVIMGVYREMPWHKLAIKDLESYSSGLTVRVKKGQAYTYEQEAISGSYYTYTTDYPMEILGVNLGVNYKVIQHSELIKLARVLPAEGDWIIESGGTLCRKALGWISLRNQRALRLFGQEINRYLLLFNSHNGSTGFGGQPTTVNVVCKNTFDAARRGKRPLWSIKHTSSAEEKIRQLRTMLKRDEEYQKEVQEMLEELAEMKEVTLQAMGEIGHQLLKPGDKILSSRTENQISQIIANWRFSPSITPEMRPTGYGAYMAITEWLDHQRFRELSKQVYNSWFGSSVEARAHAVEVIRKCLTSSTRA